MTTALVTPDITSEDSSNYRDAVGLSHPVRRPMRGLLLKEEAYATLSVTSGTLVNSSMPEGQDWTTNFLLQSVTESRNEKAQYVTTFGSTYAFFFGEQPRLINCSAVLLNTPDFNWEKEWLTNYEDKLRGSSLTATNSKAILEFDGQVVTGYLTNCTTIKSSQDPNLVNLNFSMFVENISYGEDIGSTTPYERDENGAELLGVGSITEPEGIRILSQSTSDAVRKANIALQASNQDLFLSSLRGKLSSLEGAIDANIRRARNILYGRNLVVSRSFIADSSGPSAESVTVRTRTEGSLPESAPQGQHTYNNLDEYIGAPPYQVPEEYRRPGPAVTNISNLAQVQAFAEVGIAVPTQSLEGASIANWAVDAYQRDRLRRQQAEIVQAVSRAGFGVATFIYGQSLVNRRRDIQETITNPNSGGLDPETVAELQAQISETTRNTEQDRLVAEAEAERLRGNTGTVTPGLPITLLDVLT